MDPIKVAFQKVREDIDNLSKELSTLKEEYSKTDSKFEVILSEIKSLKPSSKEVGESLPFKEIPLFFEVPSTDNFSISTVSTHPSTDNPFFKPLEAQNIGISTGNGGVQTDRQTHQQTDKNSQNASENQEILPENPIEGAAKILSSLDSLKKEIRLKFKRLTDQEFLVFSTLYQLDEEQGYADYKSLSRRLNLTESSIRDYVGRLISKGIPVDKTKINNKSIQLKVSESLKKVASLPTILHLINI